MTTAIMLDLETLDITHSAVILTMGAVKFDPYNPAEEPHSPIYLRLNIEEQLEKGRTVGDGTMEWWGKQPIEIFDEAMDPTDRISIEDFLTQLSKYRVGADKIWAQGVLFDIDILENLYRSSGQPVPWMYYDIRDSRTVMDMGDATAKTSNTIAHNALADAYCQAVAVQTIYDQCGVTEKTRK